MQQDYDAFVESVKLAGSGDWNLNEVDTSQFKCKRLNVVT